MHREGGTGWDGARGGMCSRHGLGEREAGICGPSCSVRGRDKRERRRRVGLSSRRAWAQYAAMVARYHGEFFVA